MSFINLNNAEAKPISTLILENKLNSLFFLHDKNKEERKGLHASAIIAGNDSFCLREQVLSLFFKRNEEEIIPVGLARIFAEGNAIHEKWQNLFVKAGLAIAVEDRSYSIFFDLFMTPDIVVEINGKIYVVEVKSCNTYSFQKMTNCHPSGTKQLQLYMHFLCIPRGIVLAEDKNTQEFKVFEAKYEPGQSREYIARLFLIKTAKENFEKDRSLPIRMCNKSNCKRAEKCAMSDACFNKRAELIK